LQQALKKRSMELAATGNYERNTVAVKGALLQIRKAEPDAVVMVGAYKPCAEFIKLAKKVGMKETIFCNISFVGTESLRKELGPDGEGCIVSQVVPLPWSESIPLVAEYRAAMKKHQPDAGLGFTSLEGYMAGKLFCMTMNKLEGEPTREAFIEALEKAGPFDLGGETLKFSSNAHQGMDEVFLTVIKDGTVGAL
jgi:ABC-type branched-subunit amino acid transport system substrate-binding protein